MSWISKKNLVSKNISGGVKDYFRYDWKMECCQCLLIFTHSIGSRSHRKESNDCTKFGLSNFNVLCFVTLLYVFFLVKSDLLSMEKILVICCNIDMMFSVIVYSFCLYWTFLEFFFVLISSYVVFRLYP